MILTRKQEDGLKLAVTRYNAKEKYTVIAGYAGTGKAQPVDTIIPTPNGKRRLGDIQLGDYVYDRQGNPTKVIGIYPQGKLDSYIVTFEDGRTTKCNDEHIWTYYTSKGNLANKTLKDMMTMGLKYSGKGCFKFKIPNNEPIFHEAKNYNIDPYVIGCFLGDGCCKERLLTLSSKDEELINLVAELIDCSSEKSSSFNYSWTFSWNNPKITKGQYRDYNQYKPQTKEFFKNYITELCCSASEKKIPENYKYGSFDQRWSLIQGLMDTDGTIDGSDGIRFNMRYTSTSLQLIKDFQMILYELGYKSTITEDKREEKYTNKCYTLNILAPNEDKYKFFRLKRKKDIALEAAKHSKRKDYSKIAIIDVQKEEVQREMVCIMVDNEEHLYLTNDYIVTHNTTLVKHIIAALNVDEEDVVYCAYTGKACTVLQSKGNRNVSTLHRLLWEWRPMSNGKFFRKRKEIVEKIVVVDEVSMVNREIITELLSRKDIYILFLGDPGQLPPIDKDSAHDLLDKPHIFLDEVMRQAAESEIIRLTMDIRAGKPLQLYKGKEVMVLNKSALNTGMLTWADQVLCATNQTRAQLNKQMRELAGRGEMPENGDKVICIQNHWHELSENENPLVNGTIGFLDNIYDTWVQYPSFYDNLKVDVLGCNLITETNDKFSLDIDKQMLITEQPTYPNNLKYKISKNKNFADTIPYEFLYGYAITCHKAQGSEWGKFLVLEEKFPFNRDEHIRWLYTAATRASEKLVIIRKE